MKLTKERLTQEVVSSGVWSYQGPGEHKSPVVWWMKLPGQLIFFKRLTAALHGERTVWTKPNSSSS